MYGTCSLYGAGRNDFDAGNIHFARCHFRAQKSLDFQCPNFFFAQMALALLAVISGLKKVSIL
jgi:hypothetical protein